MNYPMSDISTAALAFRMSLSFPDEFDRRKTRYCIFLDEVTEEFVSFSVRERSLPSQMPDYLRREEEERQEYAMVTRARDLWFEKYGVAMPDLVAEQFGDSGCMLATCIPYQGPTPLTSEQWQWVKNAAWHVTVADLFLIVEGLGWRPGQPVDENDEKWIAVWAEDLECGNTLNCYRSLLNMDVEPNYQDPGWRPPAVERLCAQLNAQSLRAEKLQARLAS